MKPRYTPLNEIETYLKSENGKKAIFSLSKYIPEMESEFDRIKKAIPFRPYRRGFVESMLILMN
jgi:hypothetical protein